MTTDLIIVEKPRTPWERMPGEPHRWYMNFHEFLMLGPNRSLAKAVKLTGKKSTATWSIKATQWDWHRRAEAFDLHQAEQEEQMKWDVMHRGLALDWERVKLLKQVVEGEAEIVLNAQKEIRNDRQGLNDSLTKRYNAVVGSLSKNLDSIASEKGERVKKVSIKRELRDFAIELARSQGYEEAVAIEIADMIALEGP